ncbi:MAG TPA: carboxypeptidase regulatory-like domain-containing protein [Acidobacteriota bacterium]|nr:carboxypeptidase regulatory-like domain-containing protein [Acidobacteriota bacterium]HQG90229.1 carboxypeptidase regulatory-like domain-containing protein [Acidobacteriota bacterium]HQK85992.1 carboxypeptidase regulatory-like domain-containing protein [Acidobacteriota bacterium]
MNHLSRLLVLSLLLAFLAVSAMAEGIEGVVKDNTGGVIPGVTVILTSTDTGATRQALSDDNGFYIFTNLRIGNYEIKAELEGFQPVKITGIKLSVGENLNFPVVMTVSEVTTEVEVRAEVEQVETTTSQLDTVIDEKRITDLPLNGRNPLSLIYLTPGVVQGQTGYASANGGRERGNNYQIDGIDNNYTQTIGNTVDINVDATSEFRVVTSNPSAEYGRAGGAIIDVVTKSGTNEFHGAAFYFLRSENFDAKTWAQNRNDLEKGDFKRHQYGASIGGPIVKDKVFFFFNTEILDYRASATSSGAVPYPSWVADNVTNPAIAQIFSLYPAPNGDEVIPGVSAYYYWGQPDVLDTEQYTAKVDYNFNEAHSFSFRWIYNHGVDPALNSLPTFQDDRPWNGKQQQWGADWTWIVSPTIVNSFKLGYSRGNNSWVRETIDADLVFGGYAVDPQTYFTSYTGLWGYGSEYSTLNMYQVKDTVTWTLGTHALKFGMDLRWNQNNGGTGFNTIPAVFFDGWRHGGDTLANIAAGTADYVNHGVYSDGTTFSTAISDWRGWRQKEWDFFVQDDWKILSNLTLNMGLRWEYKPAPFDVNNMASNVLDPVANGYHIVNQNNWFAPENWENGEWWNLIPSQWVGTGSDIFIAGPDTGMDLYDAPMTNWAPRLGFSWDPFGDGKTAIRGGYGISFDRIFGNLLTWNTSQLPFGVANWLDARPGGGYDGTYPNNVGWYGNGYDLPEVELHLPAETWYEMVLYNYNWSTPYIQTWNLSAQREIWPGNILNLTYAGSAGVNLLARNNPNQMFHPSEATIQGLADNLGVTASVPWYVVDYSVQNSQWYRIHHIDTYCHSNYHAFQGSFSHRFQDGLQFQVNYTWSTAFDNNSESVYTLGNSSPFASDYYNLSYDRGYAAFDVRHVFSGNFIYELPFGPGKWLGGDAEGWLAQLIGGWQINGIMTANSGYPLDYKVARDTLGTGYTNARGPARPNVVTYEFSTDPENNIVGPTAANFSFASSVINLRHPQGDYYRGKFRGPGHWNVDFSLFKDVKLPWFTAEGSKLQLRAEAFNLFNHTNYGNPNTTLTSVNLGKSFSAGANRQIQFGLKFIF